MVNNISLELMYAYISIKLKWLYHQFLYPDGLLKCFLAR
ncbi:Uncharacterised protein [Klebsiella michiganensis]|uniref:Uncharacterized protein n=1 Tax=Klebsiella michiganensis TaxID=1134687 RepID=A0A7H4PRA1_9ENTR|nr:Uncharacterised protein [Klebsiella michiganensis]